jgi:hypothetical protein
VFESALLIRSSLPDSVKLQPAEASIRSLRASLVFQPSLILQLRDKSIPVGGPLSGGYSTAIAEDASCFFRRQVDRLSNISNQLVKLDRVQLFVEILDLRNLNRKNRGGIQVGNRQSENIVLK